MKSDNFQLLYSVHPQEEEIPPSHPPMPGMEADPEFVAAVQQMIDDYGIWGWCVVVVRASFGPFTGEATLSGSSYKDAEDFKQGGYYEQMCEEALEDLKKNISSSKAAIAAFDELQQQNNA